MRVARLMILAGLSTWLVAAVSWGGTSKPPAAAPKGKVAQGPSGRSKSIEFEDGLVEGVNKNPGDFSTKTTKWKDRKEHLYRKQIDFGHEMQETLRETRYAQ